jgi:L-lactate dehydrogenase complex protein LldE
LDVALFVPCYVDQLAPEVAFATLRVLERAGCRVRVPADQTCCGQPFLNAGAARQAARLARLHLARFADCDTVVTPSGSCAATVRLRFPEIGAGAEGPDVRRRARTFELSEFLVRVLGRTALGARFPHRVALLQSCHGLRDLGLGTPSERVGGPREAGPAETLLREVRDLTLVSTARADECCGFGGAFSVKLPEVSARMGRARLRELEESDAEFVTGTDVSCLLHLEGLRRRLGRGPRALHLAEILAAAGPR